jgi:hypothetical protein
VQKWASDAHTVNVIGPSINGSMVFALRV